MPDVDHRAWGVQDGYHDVGGTWHDTPPSAIAAALEAMGAGPDQSTPDAGGSTWFVSPGSSPAVEGPAMLTTEGGAVLWVEGELPADLPLGYHTLNRMEDGAPVTIVVSPGRCPLPSAPGWGWAVQLYAARSRQSWGMGDLGDLSTLARWSASDLGAGLVLVNPLHAAHPGAPQQASPYYPSSRLFRSPLYLRIEDVPGAAAVLGPGLEELAAAGRALNADRRIDRDEVWRLKHDALKAIWDSVADNFAFDRWRDATGEPLQSYATFCVLAEEYGRDWKTWPEKYRHPGSSEVVRFGKIQRRRVRFHQWVQWLLDRQLASASSSLPVMHDLALGVDPAGADAWMWQDAFALDMSVGAPPDTFNTRGQDWGVPPFNPWALRACGYQPFVETIRATLRHAGGLRLDHVMGLFRQWWVPAGGSAADGVYVRYPAGDLLDIVALECHRAGAYAVGEDLGTVEDQVRTELRSRGVLSYRVVWFEDRPPPEYPEQALASVSTHDLPTVAGLWTGSDFDDQRKAGMEPDERSTEEVRARLRRILGLRGDAEAEEVAADEDGLPTDEVVARTYECLGQAPSLLLTAALEDALAVAERPNMPGTTDEWPNWSIALPAPLEDLMADPRAHAIARSLARPRPEPSAAAEPGATAETGAAAAVEP
jgi:4-alpha-glucanotransferase